MTPPATAPLSTPDDDDGEDVWVAAAEVVVADVAVDIEDIPEVVDVDKGSATVSGID